MALRDWISNKAATVATTATDPAQVPALVALVADVATSQRFGNLVIAAEGADVARRRAKALAMLEEDPQRQMAVVAEAGDPSHVAIAVHGFAVGDLEIPAEKYDAFALLALMQRHGNA